MTNIPIAKDALTAAIIAFFGEEEYLEPYPDLTPYSQLIENPIRAFLIAEGFPTTTNETVKDFVKKYELAAESASAYKLHSTNMENLLNIHLGLFEKIYSNYIYNKDQSSAMSEITKILLNNNKWTS